jgi:hypothetical protein
MFDDYEGNEDGMAEQKEWGRRKYTQEVCGHLLGTTTWKTINYVGG